MPHLQYIDFSGNDIQDLPVSLLQMKHLKKFNVDYNLLSEEAMKIAKKIPHSSTKRR
jgi:Leucine-rich repeat (LRR) protein